MSRSLISYKKLWGGWSKKFWRPKNFVEDSNDTKDVYNGIEEYNPGKKRKVLRAFDDMIADTISNEKFPLVVTELFIRGHQLNIFRCLLHNYNFLYKRMWD